MMKLEPYITLMTGEAGVSSIVAELYASTYIFLRFRDKKRHAFLRRVMASGFSNAALTELTPTLKKYLQKLIDGIKEDLVNNNGNVTLNNWFTNLSFDVFPSSINSYDSLLVH